MRIVYENCRHFKGAFNAIIPRVLTVIGTNNIFIFILALAVTIEWLYAALNTNKCLTLATIRTLWTVKLHALLRLYSFVRWLILYKSNERLQNWIHIFILWLFRLVLFSFSTKCWCKATDQRNSFSECE